jgi:hypothetical protein
MPRGQHREEATLLLLAALLLVVGVIVYAVDRGGAAYFLIGWAPSQGKAELFGPLGNHLPTFVHSLAMILVTAAVLRPWSNLLPAIVIGWVAVECLFEIGQISPFDAHVAAVLPAWFDDVPVLEASADYFLNGTCDPLDFLSIGLGAAAAYWIVRTIERGGLR